MIEMINLFFFLFTKKPKTATQKSNQYWFVLKQSGDLPGQYILDYYTDSTCKKQKGRVDLDQCRKVDETGVFFQILQNNISLIT